MLLYFAAGLLPDPDGPFTPMLPNLHTWTAAIGFEISLLLASNLKSRFLDSDSPTFVEVILFTCRLLKACLLIAMCGVFIGWRRRMRKYVDGKDGDCEHLLANGHGVAPSYNGVPLPPSNKPAIKADAQTTGWLDYLYGFRALFPFIWYVKSARSISSLR